MFHHVTELFLMLDPERLELIDLLLCLFKVVDTILLFFPLHELQTFAIQAHNQLNLFLDLFLHQVSHFVTVLL